MAREKIDIFIKQLDGVWKSDEWVVPMSRALRDLGPREAAWQPPGEGNTVWQILRHQNFYNERILSLLQGKELREMANNTSTFGPPGDPQDEAGWEAEKERAFRLSDELRGEIFRLEDEDLSVLLHEGATTGELLAAWLAHDAFHGGQIVLLRKLQNAWPGTVWP